MAVRAIWRNLGEMVGVRGVEDEGGGSADLEGAEEAEDEAEVVGSAVPSMEGTSMGQEGMGPMLLSLAEETNPRPVMGTAIPVVRMRLRLIVLRNLLLRVAVAAG